jgi:hypothetical protein
VQGQIAVLAWLFVAMFAPLAAVALFKVLERVQAIAITLATFSLLGARGRGELRISSGHPDIASISFWGKSVRCGRLKRNARRRGAWTSLRSLESSAR